MKKIPVDKDFLDMILDKVAALEKKLENKDAKEVKPIVSVDEKYIFNCRVTAPYVVSPQTQMEFDVNFKGFTEELKTLMVRYNFIVANAEFLSNNIQ